MIDRIDGWCRRHLLWSTAVYALIQAWRIWRMK